jgi:hypothetical protein
MLKPRPVKMSRFYIDWRWKKITGIVIDVLTCPGQWTHGTGSVAYVSISIYLSIFFEADGMRGEGKNRWNLSFTSVITTSFSLVLLWSVQRPQEDDNTVQPCFCSDIAQVTWSEQPTLSTVHTTTESFYSFTRLYLTHILCIIFHILPNVVVKELGQVHRIRVVPSSNLGTETGYPEFLVVLLSPSMQIPEYYLKLGYCMILFTPVLSRNWHLLSFWLIVTASIFFVLRTTATVDVVSLSVVFPEDDNSLLRYGAV